MRKRIALVGYGPSGKEAPFRDKRWECWGLNNLHEQMEGVKFARWFQLHRWNWLANTWSEPFERHRKWLKKQSMPVYVWDTKEWRSDAPSCLKYPKAKVEALTSHGYYHTWSMDWMLALAVYMHPPEIHCFGFQGLVGEPMRAGQSSEYWMGVAEGRGIPVTVHGENEFFKNEVRLLVKHQYGVRGYPNIVWEGYCDERIAALDQYSPEQLKRLAAERGDQ